MFIAAKYPCICIEHNIPPSYIIILLVQLSSELVLKLHFIITII